MKPTVRLVTATTEESSSKHEFNVPAGIFVSPDHTWVNIEMDGTVRVGIDDFVRKIIEKIDEIELPKLDQKVKKGDILFMIKRGNHSFKISSPISGKVILINNEHLEHPEWIAIKPFELSWMCCIEPSDLSEELHSLKIGQGTVKWYQEEIEKFDKIIKEIENGAQQADTTEEGKKILSEDQKDEEILKEFSKSFFNN
jgi:glycine cleavage system H lipoate-binding protein